MYAAGYLLGVDDAITPIRTQFKTISGDKGAIEGIRGFRKYMLHENKNFEYAMFFIVRVALTDDNVISYWPPMCIMIFDDNEEILNWLHPDQI